MVITQGPKAIFWYIFSSAEGRGRKRHCDERFNVALYEDGVVLYTKIGANFQPEGYTCIQLPLEVVDEYRTMLQHEYWWLNGMPENIVMENAVPTYCSKICFEGHPAVYCDEMKQLAMLPDDNRNGVYARRLHVMLEFFTEVLFKHGVLFTMDYFNLDWKHVHVMSQYEMAAWWQSFGEQPPTTYTAQAQAQ